jgi:hypothetical protein
MRSRRAARAAQRLNRHGGNFAEDRDAVGFESPTTAKPYIALTMLSLIFLASPSSIMVLSR